MRNRFFFIILTTLIFSVLSITFVLVHFFRSQRLQLIDKQISMVSEVLLRSPKFLSKVKDPKTLDQTLSEVLKGTRIGKAFAIREPNGKILFESFNLALLNTELPTGTEWIAVQANPHYVRVKNVHLPLSPPLLLQVGLVLDENFVQWEILDGRTFRYIAGTATAIFALAVLLTLVLLKPLRVLIAHLREATSNLANLKDVRPIPDGLTSYMHPVWRNSDEFTALLHTVQKLTDRINQNYKLTRSWASQMAHELKTPLTIIRASVESKLKSKEIPKEHAKDVVEEVERMDRTVTQFLDWAELENLQSDKDLHAIHIKSLVNAVVSRLDKIWPERIRVEAQADFCVFANPIHIEQMVTNLVINALKYSPKYSQVVVVLDDRQMSVCDQGPGVPMKVRERLGEPFNVGPQIESGRCGNGLGLAWVATVARIYNLEFELLNKNVGTAAVVRFPDVTVN